MHKCCICGADTSLFVSGVPICMSCEDKGLLTKVLKKIEARSEERQRPEEEVKKKSA